MSSEEKRPFRELLDELIDLYKRLRNEDQFKNHDIEVTGDVDFLLSNYEMVKNNLPEDAINQMGEPVRAMLEDLIGQLRREITRSEPSSTNQEILSEIDKKLARNDLSEREINELLDKRSKLFGSDSDPK